MTLHATELATPVGSLALIASDGALVAAGFMPIAAMAARARLADDVVTVSDLGPISDAASAYLDGDMSALDRMDAEQPGGVFAQAAWSAMRAVPAGTTITYAELAARTGSGGAVRAAGGACARNLLAPVVPCHRIVRTDGSAGGYAFGVRVKQWLLEHERHHT